MGASTTCCNWLSLILKGLSGITVELFFTFITSKEPVAGIVNLEVGNCVVSTEGLFKFTVAPTCADVKLKVFDEKE